MERVKQLQELTDLLNKYIKTNSDIDKQKILYILSIHPDIRIQREDEVIEYPIQVEMELQMEDNIKLYPINLRPDQKPFFYHDGVIFCLNFSTSIKLMVDQLMEELQLVAY